MYLEGGRETADFAINNADLVLDLVKSYKGASIGNKMHKHSKNINKTQIGLNLVSAGLDVHELMTFIAYVTEEQARKIDSIVNASFTTARAASSIGTAIFLPLSCESRSSWCYQFIQLCSHKELIMQLGTSQELRKLGFKEEEITLKSILKFLGNMKRLMTHLM